MKLVFAAASAAALLASFPAQAVSVISVGRTPVQECAVAAGVSTLTMRQTATALDACDAALKGDLSQTAAAGTLVNRGLIQASAGHDAAAMTDYNAAVARDPNLAASYMNRGAAFLRAARYDAARADFDRAIALNTADLHIAYFNRGGAEEAQGNLVAAYGDYRKAQDLAPNFQPARQELARFRVNERRVADNH